MKLEVVIDGPIVPTARPRVVHGRAANPRTTVEYKAKIALATRAAVAAQGWAHCAPVFIHVEAFEAPRGSDADNILKSALDGLVAGGAVKDDRWEIVRGVSINVFERAEPGLRIVVTSC